MGCADVKGCFGLQGGNCVQEGSCSAMVTYAVKGQRYEFELWATNVPSNSYVAVAFSNDNLMGDDSVSECTLVNGRVNVYMSFNEGKSNTRLRDVKKQKPIFFFLTTQFGNVNFLFFTGD